MKTRGTPAIALSLLLAGCGDRLDASLGHQRMPINRIGKGEPGPLRYDSTSEETRFKSSQAMTAGMTPAENEQFEADLMRHIKAYSGALDRSTPADVTPTDDDLMKPLNGLTAAEIHAKAESEEHEHQDANEARRKAIAEGKLKRRTTVP